MSRSSVNSRSVSRAIRGPRSWVDARIPSMPDFVSLLRQKSNSAKRHGFCFRDNCAVFEGLAQGLGFPQGVHGGTAS